MQADRGSTQEEQSIRPPVCGGQQGIDYSRRHQATRVNKVVGLRLAGSAGTS